MNFNGKVTNFNGKVVDMTIESDIAVFPFFLHYTKVPENCLVGEKGQVKISGFHCARCD